MVSSLTGAQLLSYYQGQTALTLFGSSSNSSDTTTALSNYYLAKEGIGSGGSSPASNAPDAPWTTERLFP